jgi:hypothetical protein
MPNLQRSKQHEMVSISKCLQAVKQQRNKFQNGRSVSIGVTSKARREELRTMQIETALRNKKNDSVSTFIQGQERGLTATKAVVQQFNTDCTNNVVQSRQRRIALFV